MTMNRLRALEDQGQAVWLDYLHQDILQGELRRMIDEDGLRGLTSNPSIFEKAIGGTAYDARLKAALDAEDAEPVALYERLAIADIQAAADQFRPVYDRLHGADGYVSLEVSPYLANDTAATVAEALRLWRKVDRPNLMIKVPGTRAGAPAIRQLVSEGVNVNVTLLFGIDAYLDVAEAHMAGLEALKRNGGDVASVHGVASIFVSRIDVAIDKEIDRRLAAGAGDDATALKGLRGKVAIANARIAYQRYLELVKSPRWQALSAEGASPQRLLWASTGTKDKAFSDTLYVSELIGPDTVNTIPPKTMDAFRDHGEARPTLTEGVEQAQRTLDDAARMGIDLDGVTGNLVIDGVRKFADAFDELLCAVAGKRTQMLGDRLNRQDIHAGAALDAAIKDTTERARTEAWGRRLWGGDASLWTDGDEAKWLAWLGAGGGDTIDLASLDALTKQVQAGGFTHALLMGMGGSSLGPEVLGQTFASAPGHPRLLVLDSTDPAQIARAENGIDIARTLFVVSSKSGSTLEPNILYDHFAAKVRDALGADKAGARFIAVTDPGSPLDDLAKRDGFRAIFHGEPEIGGRYSVLSNFGMVPAAIAGLDIKAFFEATRIMVRSCGASAPPAANPGLTLGLLLGVAASAGRDKATIFAAEPIADFGAWLEQLIAESTGKQGEGLVPVVDEPLGAPPVYGADRVFVSLELAGKPDPAREAALQALQSAGHPVVRITLAEPSLLGQEFFRWEIAIAVAGAVIGINPFNQPDVEASKAKTRAMTKAYEQTGKLDPRTPILSSDGLALYADPRNADALAQTAAAKTLEGYLAAHFKRAHSGDYVGLLAYLDREPRHEQAMRTIRQRVRDRLRVATVGGFGPRYLHSTGQAYKGGPNSGVFLQITAEPEADIPIPGRKASFAVVQAAQARGDFDVLAERGRRALRLDLGRDIEGGLKRLSEAVERSLG
jgi:transaldolase/glucose-6-phosphate isomerase